MYQVHKLRKNASKKTTGNKKIVLNSVQREEIIDKNKNGYCSKKLAPYYMAAFISQSVVFVYLCVINMLITKSCYTENLLYVRLLKKARILFGIIGYCLYYYRIS